MAKPSTAGKGTRSKAQHPANPSTAGSNKKTPSKHPAKPSTATAGGGKPGKTGTNHKLENPSPMRKVAGAKKNASTKTNSMLQEKTLKNAKK